MKKIRGDPQNEGAKWYYPQNSYLPTYIKAFSKKIFTDTIETAKDSRRQ